jgi:hypothetical protein
LKASSGRRLHGIGRPADDKTALSSRRAKAGVSKSETCPSEVSNDRPPSARGKVQATGSSGWPSMRPFIRTIVPGNKGETLYSDPPLVKRSLGMPFSRGLSAVPSAMRIVGCSLLPWWPV